MGEKPATTDGDQGKRKIKSLNTSRRFGSSLWFGTGGEILSAGLRRLRIGVGCRGDAAKHVSGTVFRPSS